MSLREGTGTSRSAAQQWHAARGMQNLAKQPKDDHATSLGQNRSAPCIRGRQCAPRRSGAAIRQHRGGIPLGSRSKCGVRPRAASAMVPRGGHRLNEPVVGEVGGRGGRGPDPLHPETPPFSKRVPLPVVIDEAQEGTQLRDVGGLRPVSDCRHFGGVNFDASF